MRREGSPVVNVLLVAGSWLVPGLGFAVKGDYWRGAAVFLILNVTFALGLLLHGTVLVPEFNYRSQAFNVVNLLTYVGQMGNGGASLVCLARGDDEKNRPAGRDTDQRGSVRENLGKLQRKVGGVLRRVLPPARERDALFDLATLFLLVSGCMNYFCMCNFYDRHVGKEQDETESKEKQ